MHAGQRQAHRIDQVFDLMATQRTVRSLKPEPILELERKAALTEFPPLHSLTSYWRIDLRDRPERIEEVVTRLNALPEVDRAYREFDVTDPLVNDVDDDYAADQDYLDAAPTGIDARWAWTQPNAEGSGVAGSTSSRGGYLTTRTSSRKHRPSSTETTATASTATKGTTGRPCSAS